MMKSLLKSSQMYKNRQKSEQQNPQIQQPQNKRDSFNLQTRLDAQFLRINIQQQIKQCKKYFSLEQQELSSCITHYKQLPYSPINIQQLLSSKKTRLIRSCAQKIYVGSTLHKKKHGIGLSLYSQGKIYQGQYSHNQKHGNGIQVYSNGNIYIGSYTNNKKHGKGIFYWFSLSTIPCTKNSEVFIEHYKGQWWGGLPDGLGQHCKSNGDIYKGKFKNGLKHGNGIQFYSNGDIYQGDWINGLQEGYGEFISKEEEIYKGDFKQGYRNGFGKLTHKGETYQGHFMLDRKHGYGVENINNTYVYKGNFSDGLRSGEGLLFFQDQLVYQGLWVQGEPFQREQNFRGSHLFTEQSTKLLRSKQSWMKNNILKTQISNSKQKRNDHEMIFPKSLSKSQKYHMNKLSRPREKTSNYCVSFKKEQMGQKIRIGHRNCIPCNTLRNKSAQHSHQHSNKKK